MERGLRAHLRTKVLSEGAVLKCTSSKAPRYEGWRSGSFTDIVGGDKGQISRLGGSLDGHKKWSSTP